MFAREVIMNLKTCVKAKVLTIGLAGIVTAGIVNAEDILQKIFWPILSMGSLVSFVWLSLFTV